MNQKEPDYAEPQRQVQRWLGRCMLSLQQSERMLKAFLVDSQFSVCMPIVTSGPPHVARAHEQGKVATMTLGGLVSLFCSDVIVEKGQLKTSENTQEKSVHQLVFDTRYSIPLEKAEHEQLVTSMREMVQIRNELVHHLVERFDLISLEGCVEAQAFLQQNYERIEAFRKQLQSYGEHMSAMRQHLQDVLTIESLQSFLATGRVPLKGTSMMDAMKIAFASCAQNCDSVPLNTFTTWQEQHRPAESYEQYGRVSWAQLIHESGVFRIQRSDEEGHKIVPRVVRR